MYCVGLVEDDLFRRNGEFFLERGGWEKLFQQHLQVMGFADRMRGPSKSFGTGAKHVRCRPNRKQSSVAVVVVVVVLST
jgi:hypothetical protein